MRQLRKRPSSKEDIVAILVERSIEREPLGNFQDLKKLIPMDAAGFMVAWAGPPGDAHAADSLEDVHATADALEDAQSAADLEQKAMIPDATAHPVAARNGFVARIRSSGTTAAATATAAAARLTSTKILYRLPVESV